MRKSSWSIALAVLLSVSVTACRSAQDHDGGGPGPTHDNCAVTIVVSLGPDGNPIANPPTQIIRPWQEVEWIADDPTEPSLEITAIVFKQTNPFPNRPVCPGKSCLSQKPRLTGSFNYGIVVTVNGEKRESDPILIIRP